MRAVGGKGVLLVAVILGLATSYMSWRYVQQGAAARPQVETLVPVVVAQRPIPQRAVIGPGMVVVKEVPAAGRTEGAFSDTEQVVGRVSKDELVPGQQLLPHQFFLQRSKAGLAYMIPDSHRAVAVSISEVVGSGGMIIPGDRVDVYALFSLTGSRDEGDSQDEGNQTTPQQGQPAQGQPATGAESETEAGSGSRVPNDTVIALLLQKVPVLAIAQQLEGQERTPSTSERVMGRVSGQEEERKPGESQARALPGARTATLSVTPEQAQILILAEERGTIRLALRPAADEQRVEMAPLELGNILTVGDPGASLASSGDGAVSMSDPSQAGR